MAPHVTEARSIPTGSRALLHQRGRWTPLPYVYEMVARPGGSPLPASSWGNDCIWLGAISPGAGVRGTVPLSHCPSACLRAFRRCGGVCFGSKVPQKADTWSTHYARVLEVAGLSWPKVERRRGRASDLPALQLHPLGATLRDTRDDWCGRRPAQRPPVLRQQPVRTIPNPCGAGCAGSADGPWRGCRSHPSSTSAGCDSGSCRERASRTARRRIVPLSPTPRT